MSDSTLYNRLKELTIVDFERDSAETENKHSSLRSLLTQFMECEGKSCSFDPELITPEYVYRMWGGSVAIEEIATGLKELWKQEMNLRNCGNKESYNNNVAIEIISYGELSR